MLKRLISKGKRLVKSLPNQEIDPRKKVFQDWFAIKGDQTLRVDYDLNPDSIVFDLGGYEGQWSSDIYARYRCKIYVFEPGKRFFENIEKRFSHNPDFHVFNFGLSDHTGEAELFLHQDRSSIHVKPSAATCEKIKLKCASEFLSKSGIPRIDLMKINIEGSEYDLIPHIIATNWIEKIVNLQVQFHDFIERGEEKMIAIQNQLSATHELTYQYRFVWENWRLK